MENEIRRRRTARVYAWMVSAVPVVFLAIAAMIGAGHRPYAGWVDAHRGIGELFGLVAIIFLPALAFRAGFPRRLRIRELTVLLVVLWILQAMLGFMIEEGQRWALVTHFPNPILIFGLGLVLAYLSHRALRDATGDRDASDEATSDKVLWTCDNTVGAGIPTPPDCFAQKTRSQRRWGRESWHSSLRAPSSSGRGNLVGRRVAAPGKANHGQNFFVHTYGPLERPDRCCSDVSNFPHHSRTDF